MSLSAPPPRGLSYLPGLDGLRACSVVAVMLYHADPRWLPGGFLGVEVFFVISGFLITRLLVAEYQRAQRIDLWAFWGRRFRRLLPALVLMLALLMVYLATSYPEAQGRTRGDLLAGLLYVSNWYQLWAGAGYTASEAFVPLRHLWSLAVEEQFYLLWPLLMLGVLRHRGDRLLRRALGLFGITIAIHLVIAMLYVPGDIDSVCSPDAMRGYWQVLGRCVSINDALYLSTVTRLGGLVLGAALGLCWVPETLSQGPWRTEGRQLDLLALIGAAGLGLLMWFVHLTEPAHAILTGSRFDPWLFRGGLLLTGLATLFLILAVSHPGALTGRILGRPVLIWIGARSYGLYLFHWPIYQVLRGQAGRPMSLEALGVALVATLAITELSYRLIEMPVRQGALGRWWRKVRAPGGRSALVRRWPHLTAAVLGGMVTLGAGVSVAVAPVRCLGPVECATAVGRAAIDAAARTGRGVRSDSLALPEVAAESLRTDGLMPADGATALGGEIQRWADSVVVVERIAAADTVPPPTVTLPGDSTSGTDTVAVPVTGEAAPQGLDRAVPPDSVRVAADSSPPPARPRRAPYAIGESVMLGAAPQLQGGGFVVDAEVSRQGRATARRLRQLKAEGRLGEIVVLQVGTNGPVEMAVYDEIMATLPAADHPRVIFLTVYADRGWIEGNNARIWLLPHRYPNVEVVDWYGHVAAGEVRGLAEDRIHLGTLGARRFYAGMILRQINQRP